MSSMPRPRSGSPAGWPRPPASRTVTTTSSSVALEADVDGHRLEVVAVLDGVLPRLVGGHDDAGHLVGRGAHLDQPAAQHAPQRRERVGVGREREADRLAQRRLGAHEQRGDVVVDALGPQAGLDDVVAHRVDVAGRARQRAEQPREAGVDALVAALDEAVGVEGERGAGREVDDDLRRPADLGDAERRARALEQPRRRAGDDERRRRMAGVDQPQAPAGRAR